MDDDQWREDGSFQGMTTGKAKAPGKGKGPQFTRVIPKFLQKYHQPPAIQAKFATLPKAGDDEEDELDEVQQAAIDDYLAKKQEKKDQKQQENEDKDDKTDKKKTKTGQNVVQMGKTIKEDATKKKKRKRSDRPTLNQ
ncbi:hypothetical protein BBJ29_002422 [Phytophthora kernoviae]|uniref:DUF4604 domain-containing protein n=1 Tax=Phytophthora kernoviae TaxID=325452 RepID=A0A3F2RQ70_9STRA|nr:hypothetical protein BBJ29_002422 [Phytophthora kernoviae]RLN62066.1 hypothetical protein BBP00_00005003 [Phytophthora kernoviae]